MKTERDYLLALFDEAIPDIDHFYDDFQARSNKLHNRSADHIDGVYGPDNPDVTDQDIETLVKLERRKSRLIHVLRREYGYTKNNMYSAYKACKQ